MKIVVVEDELLVADHLRSILEVASHKILGIATNLKQARALLKQLPDLVLIDIKLGENDNGIQLGEELFYQKTPFIYITANNESSTLKQAVATNPSGYLTKPFNNNDVLAAVALIEARKKKREKTVPVKTTHGKAKLLINDILYVEADNVYVHIFTESKKITQRLTLKEFEELSNDISIQRVHRSYLVNTNKITSKGTDYLFVGEIKLPVSKSYKENI